MANCVITGTITANIAPSGPSASTYIGSPVTYYGSTTLTREYEEETRGSMKIDSTDGEITISLNSVALGDVLYLGADKQVEFKINGNIYTIGDGTGGSSDGGFIMMSGAGVTAITVTAALAIETTVVFVVYGE